MTAARDARRPAGVHRVESLDQDGRGVTRVDGKVTFVDGALPGEAVELEIWRRKRSFDLANATRIVRESSQRVVPRCAHYERCGGCSLQHLDPRAQVAIKQRVLEDALLHLGHVTPEHMLAPLHGPAWGYRHRARFAVRHVARKGGALVGFHERRTHYVVDMDSCEVVPPRVSALIAPLRALVSSLRLAARLPQIDVAVAGEVIALSVRVLDPPGADDLTRLREFAAAHGVDVYLQPGGPDTLAPLDAGSARPLCYRLPEFGLELAFQPGDFTQVNHAVNRVLVRRAVSLLQPVSAERIADLFCGLGNFTLALARAGAHVTGVEGSAGLVARGAENALRNGLAQRVQFRCADLYDRPERLLSELGEQEGMLLNPPRDGAHALVQALAAPGPRRIVYVSCNPATLARDAAVLVGGKGYRLRAAGVVNMFPHTSHVESIALFERG
jgi:23S rRNA (uracil1939-C5)-methyltransferase